LEKNMTILIQSIHICRYKGISDAKFNVMPINVLIGSNNAGKSTIAQIIHFSVGLLQSINLLNKWGSSQKMALSLSPDQLLYSPCADLYALGHGEALKEDNDRAISVDIVLNTGEKIEIRIKKGRNGNINVVVQNVAAAKSISSLEDPFTIYSPGLAGIARHEAYMSDGVLLRTLARGDANLVFRNVLFRLAKVKVQWATFIGDLQELFEGISLKVEFKETTDEHILVTLDLNGNKVPIELAGTGILQAIQILAYVHYFHPSVIILDEPDSHLHPNNQRLLCKLLQTVAEERGTQVILTTHSRHVVDALSGQANFLWVRIGTVEKYDQDYDLTVLLDIGALDVKEMVTHSQSKRCIVLTEDTLKRGLEAILWASGVPEKDSLVLSYHGCTSHKNLRPLLDLIRSGNQHATIIVHRDRDYLSAEEASEWESEIRKLKAEPFLTVGVDIESHFLNSNHIAELNNLTVSVAEKLITDATKDTHEICVEKYVNGRSDLAKKSGTYGSLNIGALAVEAGKKVSDDPARYRHSKTILKRTRLLFQEQHSGNLMTVKSTEHLVDERLKEICKTLPPEKISTAS
jgi:ABC-type dipeptide/oligopeptide/nickel transport system ATPase component